MAYLAKSLDGQALLEAILTALALTPPNEPTPIRGDHLS
jgi:hypothetical protein